MNFENQLPQGWQLLTLSTLCEKILGGGTPDTRIEEYWNGNIPWITSADILGIKKIVPRKAVTASGIANSASNILPKGGIVVTTRVSLGKIAIAPFDIAYSQDNHGLILNEKLLTREYALLFLSKAVQSFCHQSRGTTIKGVTKKQLADLKIALPPIKEQTFIVQKIEELFSELDKGIETLKTVQQQLNIYRQAVLKSAFDRRLTNENLEDGKLLEGWELVRINQIAKTIGGYAFKSSDFKPFGHYQVIRIGNVRPGKIRRNESPVYVDADDKILDKALLKIGDLIITQTGTRKKKGLWVHSNNFKR